MEEAERRLLQQPLRQLRLHHATAHCQSLCCALAHRPRHRAPRRLAGAERFRTSKIRYEGCLRPPRWVAYAHWACRVLMSEGCALPQGGPGVQPQFCISSGSSARHVHTTGMARKKSPANGAPQRVPCVSLEDRRTFWMIAPRTFCVSAMLASMSAIFADFLYNSAMAETDEDGTLWPRLPPFGQPVLVLSSSPCGRGFSVFWPARPRRCFKRTTFGTNLQKSTT